MSEETIGEIFANVEEHLRDAIATFKSLEGKLGPQEANTLQDARIRCSYFKDWCENQKERYKNRE